MIGGNSEEPYRFSSSTIGVVDQGLVGVGRHA
jgi:hypothetical protein